MTLKIKFLLLIINIFSFCKRSGDYEIIYEIREQNETLSNSILNIEFDSLAVLFFEYGFENSKITVKRNNLKIYEDTISTGTDILLADVKNLGAIGKNIKNTFVSINNGKYFKIELSKKYKFAGISYFRDTVLVEYLKFYPIYD